MLETHREKSIELGEEYLANKEWKKFRADVTFIMANAYRQQAEALQQISASLQTAMSTIDKERAKQTREQSIQYFERFFDLCDDFLSVMPDHKYAKDFVGMMGSVYFKRRSFEELLEKFAGFENGTFDPSIGYANKTELQGTQAMGRINYMSGLAFLASGNYDAAKPFHGAVFGVSIDGLPLDEAAVEED